MECSDLEVLTTALSWWQSGHKVCLATVVHTWGSSPRPPGSLLAIRADGLLSGSVSGGCIETDLLIRASESSQPAHPEVIHYGVTREQAHTFELPCGGTLSLVLEPLHNTDWITELLGRTSAHELVQRSLNLNTGMTRLFTGQRQQPVVLHDNQLTMVFGPQTRMLIIGAGQLSQILAHMAAPLGFEILVCDPREEYNHAWQPGWGQLLPGMPDDVVLEICPDQQTAIVALTHDPKLDDMALLEALKSSAFYVGALGSRSNTQHRRERLSQFELTTEEINRLHGPIGLHIGSRTPAEIAVSILSEIISVKNGVLPIQKKPLDADYLQQVCGRPAIMQEAS